MNLEEKDRLILINQYKILALLQPKDKKHYSEKISILEGGYEGIYGSLLEDISKETLSVEETKFALDVLEMYGTGIILSYKKISNPTLTTSQLYFPGFNTNEEFKYYSFITFFIEELDRYRELNETNNNNFRGIGENISKYRNMLIRWKELGKYDLSEENIRELINI